MGGIEMLSIFSLRVRQMHFFLFLSKVYVHCFFIQKSPLGKPPNPI